MKNYFLHIFPAFFSLSIFFSCSQTVPEINSASSSVIFDYENTESLPQIRLAVFMDLESDARRSEKFKIRCKYSGYEWECENPVNFQNGKKTFSGYSNFVMPENLPFIEGQYLLDYEDAAGEKKSVTFSVYYNREICDKNSSEVLSLMETQKYERKIAVFKENDVLSYYDVYTEDLNEASKVWERYADGEYFRDVLLVNGNRAIILMPRVYNENSHTLKTEQKNNLSDFENSVNNDLYEES
ncbi:MAG: hypothetical protein HUK25_08615 [Treponema sp.]|nr:hypothetical protein [Treponema sp.]